MRTAIFLLALISFLVFNSELSSQTITVDSISKSVFCIGDEFNVYYTATGVYNDDNVFVAQLSYPDGNFSSFYNIGNIVSTVSEIIICKIPDNATVGNQYRIRIMSSEPYFIGAENNDNIEIAPDPYPDFAYDKHVILISDSVIFSDSSKNTVDWFWNFGKDAIPLTFSGPNPPPIKYITPGRRQVKLTVESKGGCKESSDSDDDSDGGEYVHVFDCNPKIDSTAFVITSDTLIKRESYDMLDIWVCSNGHSHLENTSSIDNIFIESGGTVSLDGIYVYGGIYMKPGACINNVTEGIFIYKDGISINMHDHFDRDYLEELICDDLQFDYSEAPEKGLIAQELSVDDHVSSNNLRIFPNPGDGIFNVSLNSNLNEFTITVYNVLGTEIYTKHIDSFGGSWNGKVDLSGNPAGIYLVKIILDDRSIVEKIILR